MSHQFNQITPTDHFGWHAAYLEVYEKLFEPFKAKDEVGMTIAMLEIGTDGGGGLRMYQDYFRDGMIYGIDIAPTPDAARDQHRIMHLQADAYTTSMVDSWKQFCPSLFDIIIDDGPHTIGSQEFFVQHYPHLLSPDGIAIVEDIQDWNHVAHLAKLVPDGFFTMGIDLRHVNGRYDDILLAIWRK